MAAEELLLDDIAAYLETFEPCPVLWGVSKLEQSDLDDLRTRLESPGGPQLPRRETDEQQQSDLLTTLKQHSGFASSSNEGSNIKAQQNNPIMCNLQSSQSDAREQQQQDSAEVGQQTPERSLQSSASSSNSEESDTKSSFQVNQQRQKYVKERQVTIRPKRSRNLSRERMQNELKSLRSQSEELQQRLALMREHKQGKQKQDLLLVATWERIAKRQLEVRTQAERENRRLKTQLDHQMTLIENFNQFIGHLESATPSFVMPRNAIDTIHGVVIDPDDIAIFEHLLLELDATRSKMDSVFDENGLNAWQVGMPTDAKAQMKTRRSNIVTDAGSLYIELTDTNVVPFPLELVFNTLWECWDRQSVERGYSIYQFPGEPESVSGMKARVDICLNGHRVSLDYLSVSKLYIEDGRMTFVWRSRTKVHSLFPDMYIDETGWQVIKSMEVLRSEELTDSVTEVFSCSQLKCKTLSGSLNAHDQHHGMSELQLTSLFVSAFEEDLMQVNAMMIDMLLQDKTPASPSSVPRDDLDALM